MLSLVCKTVAYSRECAWIGTVNDVILCMRRISHSGFASFQHGGLSERALCQYCDRGFSKNNLWRHIQTVHLRKTEMFTCPVCKAQIARRDNYKRHLEIKHDLKGLINI